MSGIKIFRVIIWNISIFLFLLLLIELLMGGWFNTSFGMTNVGVPVSRTYRYHNRLYSSDSDSIVIYRRDEFGLRSNQKYKSLDEIEVLTIGGSTTDQRYVSEGKTWQDILYKESGFIVANAGIDGQSTVGHQYNYKNWFNYLEGLSPEVVIFYIGINDCFLSTSVVNRFDASILPKNKKIVKRIKNFIKDNSVLYNTYRKIKGIQNIQNREMGHEPEDMSQRKFTDTMLNRGFIEQHKKTYTKLFGDRLRTLIRMNFELWPKSQVLLVSQPMSIFYIDGDKNTILGKRDTINIEGNTINGVDYGMCMKNINNEMKFISEEFSNVFYYDMSAEFNSRNDIIFYDYCHMTPTGAFVVGKKIAGFLKFIKPRTERF